MGFKSYWLIGRVDIYKELVHHDSELGDIEIKVLCWGAGFRPYILIRISLGAGRARRQRNTRKKGSRVVFSLI
jgi:hypothetical protein